MASTTAAIRGLGLQNAGAIIRYAARGTGRAPTGNGATMFTRPAMRGFAHTAGPSKAGDAIRSAVSKTSRPQQLGNTFFQARSISTSKSILQQIRARLIHTTRVRRNNPPSPNPTPHLGSPAKDESLSLGQRMRKLSREYGWAALGVYLVLTAIDFPFCYLFVRWLGTDTIGRWEHIVLDNIKVIIPESVMNTWHEWRASMKKESQAVDQGVEMAGWGVEEADEANKKDASLATQLALAYAVHKSFIFIRVPLTAAITPKVVNVLRGWGFEIGKRTTKATRVANAAEVAAQKAEKAARKAAK